MPHWIIITLAWIGAVTVWLLVSAFLALVIVRPAGRKYPEEEKYEQIQSQRNRLES